MRTPRPPRRAREARELRLHEILPHLRDVKGRNGKYRALCPCHDDRRASLSLTETADGTLLVHCLAGCPQDRVWAELLRLAGRSRPSRGRSERPASREQRPATSRESESQDLEPAGLELAEYARAKHLNPALLQQWELHDSEWQGKPAIAIPYLNERGETVALRYRIAPHGDRFRWEQGAKVSLYGLWRVHEWDGELCYLVEGESDCHTLWAAGLPALACPGASSWKPEWWFRFLGFQRVVVAADSDEAGTNAVRELARTCPEELLPRTFVVQPPEPHKDWSAAWTSMNADPQAFRAELESLPKRPLAEWREPEEEQEPPREYIFTPVHYREIQPETQTPIVPNFIYTGSITWLMGISGVGKTSLCLEIADCLTTGGGLLWGKVPVQHARTLWLDYDHKFARLKELMDAYYGEKERDLLILPEEQRYPLSWETLQPYVGLIRREGIEVVISDTGFDWLNVIDDAKDAEAREKTMVLRELVDATGVAVVLLHHPSKAPGRTGSTMAMSGHHRYAGRADVIAELVHDGSAGQDWVRLRILKDRYAERSEYRFARQGRRFLPLEPASLPKSEWRIVEQYLQSVDEASFSEVHEALLREGFTYTLKGLEKRIARWKEKGLILTERKGFPAKGYMRLNRVAITVPPITPQGELNEPEGNNTSVSPLSLTKFRGELEKQGELENNFKETSSNATVPPLPPVSPLLNGGGTGETEPPDEMASPDLTPESDALPSDLRDWLHQASRLEDPFHLEPDEIDAVRLLWLAAREKGFPSLTLDAYNYTIGSGEQAWSVAVREMSGTPAVPLALQALQPAPEEPKPSEQPNLFSELDARAGCRRASDETYNLPTIPS